MNNQQKTIAVVMIGGAALLLLRRKPVGTVTTSEGFDLSPYGGPVIYPESIKNVARAIAKAEGFYVSGSVPQRANNPGDLKVPGSVNTIAGGITVFDSPDAGWNALYKQLMLIVTGQSNVYNLDMSIVDMASSWTATQQGPWATNVATALGVPTSTKLYQVLV